MVFEDLPLNVELFYLINHSRHPLLDSFFSYFYLLGKGWVLLIPLSFLLLFQRKHLRTFLLTLSLETLLVEVLKTLTKQPRPASLLPNVYLIEPVYHRSFPSGDTAMAFMLACFFFPRVGPYGRLLLSVYALLIAYGRIYVGAHFPLDVLVGTLLGLASCLFVRRVTGYG